MGEVEDNLGRVLLVSDDPDRFRMGHLGDHGVTDVICAVGNMDGQPCVVDRDDPECSVPCIQRTAVWTARMADVPCGVLRDEPVFGGIMAVNPERVGNGCSGGTGTIRGCDRFLSSSQDGV